jgi:hypothetical protein
MVNCVFRAYVLYKVHGKTVHGARGGKRHQLTKDPYSVEDPLVAMSSTGGIFPY